MTNMANTIMSAVASLLVRVASRLHLTMKSMVAYSSRLMLRATVCASAPWPERAVGDHTPQPAGRNSTPTGGPIRLPGADKKR